MVARRAMRHLLLLPLLGCVGLLFSQSAHKSTATYSELSPQDSLRLEQQRLLIAVTVKQRYAIPSLTKSKNDLRMIQRLLDDKVYGKSQTYELQSLGVVLGDVLTSEFPLRWVIITDKYGRDPTLRFKNTSINVNALTMISKRVEKNDPVDVFELVRETRVALSDAEKKLR